MRRLRIGLIGAGTIAQSAHLPAIRRLAGELELVAITDVRAEVAADAARRFGAEAWYVDYRELLSRPDIDLVDICTPEFLHGEQAVAAAEAGKHVLCEKPMASTLQEADAMIAAARRNGVKLMVGHSRRFTRRYQEVARLIQEGAIGEVRLVRENERRPRAMYGRLELPVSHWVPEGERPWLASAAYSQGAALTNAVHETDLARWFTGQEAVSVYAAARITEPGGEVPDFLTYVISFAGGALAAAEIVNQLPAGYPYYHMLEVIGSDGVIRAADPPMSPLEVWRPDGMTYPLNFSHLLHVDDAYLEEIAAFARCVREDTEPTLDPWDARQALALSIAIVQSSQTGQPVTLASIEPEEREA
jgi:myo-inositol 2-dehydrogenase/D-chiro-inositol 1-dehydrogenase